MTTKTHRIWKADEAVRCAKCDTQLEGTPSNQFSWKCPEGCKLKFSDIVFATPSVHLHYWGCDCPRCEERARLVEQRISERLKGLKE